VTAAIDTAQYTGAITWWTGTGAAHNGVFAASTVYKAVITLTAKSGYTFTGLGANSFSHSGAASVVNAANSGFVTITFPATGLVFSAQYREMVPAAPNTVTIPGNGASGAFPAGRTVSLSPFKIAKYETTYELWYEVWVWAYGNGYHIADGRAGHDGSLGMPPSGDRLEPVTGINWRAAVVWCNAYSERDGKEPVYYTDSTYTTVLRDSSTGAADTAVMKPGARGYRLPTEAQWEYAARGGGTSFTTVPFAYTYAGSDTVDDVAVYNTGATANVESKAPNTLGLYDMSGNVQEWCWDWYESPFSTMGMVADPTGAVSGADRVLRGGSYGSTAADCAVSSRVNHSVPSGVSPGVGFRVSCLP
jgi:formylglycine-generating enzyme required for sulfatase activity